MSCNNGHSQEKPKYEKPVIIDLARSHRAKGTCNNGSADASSCNIGAAAASCRDGSLPVVNCYSGSTAETTCVSGGTTLEPGGCCCYNGTIATQFCAEGTTASYCNSGTTLG